MVLQYDLTNDNYVDFIGELRDEARDKDKYSHGRPILPLETDADPLYIDVKLLKSEVDKGLVRIRRYDLCLINYQDPLGNVIDVDEFELYDDESKLVEFGFEGLLLGLPKFIEAVDSLADSSNVDVGTSLAVLCLVLCEAAKLELLSCSLDKAFKSEFQVRLTSWFFKLIKDWEYFSNQLLTEDHDDADCDFYLPSLCNDWNDDRRMIGVTCQDVARCLGILQAVPPPPAPMAEEFLSGTKLAEIFSVSVYFNGGGSGLVYGTIKVDTDYDTLYIYSRDRTNCESIESHGTLSLQDPSGGAIPLYCKLAITVEIVEEGGDNLEVLSSMLWDGPLHEDSYDTRLSAFVRGKRGYVIIYYTVFEKALQAVVEATLLTKEGNPDASPLVCGKLSAHYCDLPYISCFRWKYFETVLFDKPVSKEWEERVELGESIKLPRSCVSVPVYDALIIKADLKSSEGNPIATGSMEWLPRNLGDFQGIMEGHPNDSHLLQVKVKWNKIIHSGKIRYFPRLGF
ncbi:Ribosome-inactivating protein charybdin [Bienertia sinuspersici]